jgi:MFS family permease
MQNIAQPWLALTITNDAFLVSLVSAVQFMPTLFFSLFSGVILDRVNKKRVLQITQTGFLLVSILFALMAYTNQARYSYILILAFCMGLFNALDAPCRQAFIYELIDNPKDLPNAIALNSMSFNIARILGPSLAGIVMANFGPEACFSINAISFLAILISLFFIHTNSCSLKVKTNQNVFNSISEGLKYVRKKRILITPLIILLIIATFIPNFNILISAFSKFILKGDEGTFGYLMSFLGIGSFLGAFSLALNSKKGPNQNIIHTMPFISGILLVLSGMSGNFWTAGIMLALTGFTFVTTTSMINSTLQLNTDNEYRGRVMSLYTWFFQGSTPIGGLYAGFFANRINPKWGFYSCGMAVLILMSILMAYHFFIHPNSNQRIK